MESRRILIITRHTGLLDWLAVRGISGQVITHLADNKVASGDIVIGTLPVHLVAEISAVGAFYIHVRIDVPEQLRGKELDRAALEQLDVSLVSFAVSPLSSSEIATRLPLTLLDIMDGAASGVSPAVGHLTGKSPKG